MSAGPGQRRGLAVPPACDVLPAVLAPDLQRARVLGSLAAWLATGDGARPAWVDLGQQGRSFDETTAELARQGCGEVALVGGPHDGGATRLFAESLAAAGLSVVSGEDGPLDVGGVQRWWQDAAPSGARGAVSSADVESASAATTASPAATRPTASHAATEATAAPAARSWPTLLIAPDASAAAGLGRHGVVFVDDRRGGLRRASPGPTSGILASLDRVRVHAPGVTPAAADEPHTLHVVCLRRWPENAHEARRLAAPWDGVPSARRRLALVPEPAPASGRAGGVAWAARCGLWSSSRDRVDPHVVEGLRHAVTAFCPEALGELSLALTWWRSGLSPLDQLAARRGLPDRNAELLVNIVPQPRRVGP